MSYKLFQSVGLIKKKMLNNNLKTDDLCYLLGLSLIILAGF